ncbi:hypothetical protein [Nocardia vaccinii]|uniref:hypothetical protein n=1 Tax=Nocardia vaccinii TaxID=1822 RepID=UPI0012F51CAC|nr:hypothetical protein [Nocardia vaccinii]
MSEKPHPGRWERHNPGRGDSGVVGTDSAVFPLTVGLILLIPALVSVGPVGAAILLRQHNGAAVGAALLVATVATGVVLIVVACLAFAVARRRSRHPKTPRMRAGTSLRGNGIRMNRRRAT